MPCINVYRITGYFHGLHSSRLGCFWIFRVSMFVVAPYPGPTHFLLYSADGFILIPDANAWDPGIKIFMVNFFVDSDRSASHQIRK